MLSIINSFATKIMKHRSDNRAERIQICCIVRRRVNTSARESCVREITTSIPGSFIRRIEEGEARGDRKICFVLRDRSVGTRPDTIADGRMRARRNMAKD